MVLVIKRVELQDFLSHEKTIVDFEQGVTAIIGDNGAGKTSIIDGIITAFTKITRDLRGGKESLIRYGKNRARIIVDFIVDNIGYRVERMIPRTGTDEHLLYLVEDGKKKLLARGVTSVTRELSRIIGLDVETLKRIMVFRQGMIQDLLDLFMSSKDEKQKLLDKLLGLYKYEKARDELNKVLKIALIKPNGVRAEYKPTEESVKNLRYELEYSKKRLKELDEEIEKNKQVIEEKKVREKELEAELRDLEIKANSLRNRIEEIIPLLSEYERLLAEKNNLEKQVEETRKLLNEKKTLLTQIENKIREIEPKAKAYEKLIRASQLLSELKTLNLKKREYEKILNALVEVKRLIDYNVVERYDRLLKLSEQINSLNKVLSEHRKELESINKEIEVVEREFSLLKLEYEKLSKEFENPEKIEQELRLVIEKKSRLQNKREDIASKINALKDLQEASCPICKRPLPFDQRLRLIQEYSRQLKDTENQLNEINKRYLELTMKLNMAKSMEEKLRKIETQIKIRKEKLDMLKNRKQQLMNDIDRLVKDLERLKEEYSRLEKENIRKLYEKYLNKLGEAKGYKIKDLEKVRAELDKIDEEMKKRVSNLDQIIRDVATLLDMEPKEILYKIDNLIQSYETYLKDYENHIKLRDEVIRVVDNLEGRIKAYQESLKKVVERLSQINYEKLVEEYNTLREEISDIEEKEKELRRVLTEVKSSIKSLEDINSRLLAEVKRHQDFIKEAEKYLKILELAYYLRENVFHHEKLPAEIRYVALRLLEEEASRILQEFELEYTNINIDKEVNITVSSSNMTRRLNELSGGEQVAVILAIILALHKIIGRGRLGSLILDEPTIHLDSERRRRLVEIIKKFRGGTLIPQLIVVTHHREVEDAADYVYEVSKSIGGISRVKPLSLM